LFHMYFKTLLFFGITIILAASQNQYEWRDQTINIRLDQLYLKTKKFTSFDLAACKEPERIWNEPMPLKFLGPSIVLSSNDENITLCPGDAFGDLNNTYFVIKRCYLEMYHQDKLIWSSRQELESSHLTQLNEECAFFLEKDGDLSLVSQFRYKNPREQEEIIGFLWTSNTNYNPLKTELKTQDQEFQIIQTFKDGTQKLFALSETHPQLEMFMGKPTKVGDSGFVKNHTDNELTILRNREYIGDLDGLHLILHDNCELSLKNYDHTIWSFRVPRFRPSDCSLVIQEEKWISLRQLEMYKPFESLMIDHSFQVLQSEFILKDDRLVIIQTLKDGSQLTFESQPFEDADLRMQRIGFEPTLVEGVGLKMQRREPRQIANNNFTVTNEATFTIERMDYIGNLSGLHLILQDNCTLMLFNGQQKLWQLKSDTHYPFMECFARFSGKYTAHFEWKLNSWESEFEMLSVWSSSSQQLMIENNYILHTIDDFYKNISRKYYAGQNTHGGWSQQLSERSLMIDAQAENDLSFPKRAHVGDLTGVYLMFEDNCNWVLHNQSQVLWESGTAQSEEVGCKLLFKTDGNLVITYSKLIGYDDKNFITYLCGCGECEAPKPIFEDGELWSTKNMIQNIEHSKAFLTSELSIQNNWLWLTKTYQDGTVQKFKA